MSVHSPVKPKLNYDGNLAFFGSITLAVTGWSAIPEGGDFGLAELAFPIGMGFAASFGAIVGAKAIWDNYRLRKSWEYSQTPYQGKDDRLLEREERLELGMFEPDGRLLGASMEGEPLFLPTKIKPAFQIIHGGQGTGKTTTAAMCSSVLTPLSSGASVYVCDPKKEIMPCVIAGLRELGIEVLCSNIGSGAQEECPSVETPPFELAIDAYFSDDKFFYQKTTTFVRGYAKVVIEDDGSQNSAFFIKGGRRFFFAILIYLIIFTPEQATPTKIYEIAAEEELALKCLVKLKRCKPRDGDTVAKDGIKAASTLLRLHERVDKYLSQFIEKVTDGLACYDLTGPLANYGENAVARISDLRKRKMVFAVMTPLDAMDDVRIHTSIMSYNFFQSVKAYPRGIKVHGLIEEFTTQSIPNFHREMLTLRGLGLSAELYIQSFNGLIERIGETATKTIYGQADILQISGIEHDDAKTISEVIGNQTIRRSTGSIRGSNFEDVEFGFQDHQEPIFTPQMLSSLPLNEQVVKIRGHRADIGLKIPYWDVDGLKQLISENPLEGPPPKAQPKLGLKISKNGVKVLWWRKQKVLKDPQYIAPRKERILRASSFLWLYAWAAIILMGGYSFSKPEPLVYFAQSHKGCEYIGLYGVRAIKSQGKCHPLWIRQGGR